MFWYYADWSWVQQMLAMATSGVLALAAVAGIVAWVRSHGHEAPGHVVTPSQLVAHRHAGRRAA